MPPAYCDGIVRVPLTQKNKRKAKAFLLFLGIDALIDTNAPPGRNLHPPNPGFAPLGAVWGDFAPPCAQCVAPPKFLSHRHINTHTILLVGNIPVFSNQIKQFFSGNDVITGFV